MAVFFCSIPSLFRIRLQGNEVVRLHNPILRGAGILQRVERNRPGRGRKNRMGLSLETLTETSLNRLAVSCNMTPTTLAYLMVKHCLNDANIVDLFQMDYNANPSYWCIPMTHRNGERLLEVVKK